MVKNRPDRIAGGVTPGASSGFPPLLTDRSPRFSSPRKGDLRLDGRLVLQAEAGDGHDHGFLRAYLAALDQRFQPGEGGGRGGARRRCPRLPPAASATAALLRPQRPGPLRRSWTALGASASAVVGPRPRFLRRQCAMPAGATSFGRVCAATTGITAVAWTQWNLGISVITPPSSSSWNPFHVPMNSDPFPDWHDNVSRRRREVLEELVTRGSWCPL